MAELPSIVVFEVSSYMTHKTLRERFKSCQPMCSLEQI